LTEAYPAPLIDISARSMLKSYAKILPALHDVVKATEKRRKRKNGSSFFSDLDFKGSVFRN
jgi:hypothetical protein